MTKKELINNIINKNVKSVKVQLDSYSEDIKINCNIGKIVLKSYKSYDEISELLITNGYRKATNFYNGNIIYFDLR